MSIRSFWIIFLRIIGIWLLFNSISVAVQIGSSISMLKYATEIIDILLLVLPMVIVVALYYLIIKFVIKDPSWLIDKLNLETGFPSETIGLDIKEAIVIRVAIIFIGGFMFVDVLPYLCQEIFESVREKYTLKESPKSGIIIFHFVKMLIGLFIMTNSKYVYEFFQKEKNK